MPVTQSLNSKANVKKNTNQDVPFSAQQPVMNSYYAVSTAGQTVINLSYSVDQSSTDQFFLFVDGKKLRLGASNDYIFTAIGADNRSSQVTLNQSLAINLNIQAYVLGLKSEVEFGTDSRFTQAYAAQDAGFQAFVDQNSFVSVATATPGTPAAGTFYSSIINRAAMSDLSQNLRANMGIDRIQTQQITQVQNEFGPNGELVFSSPNDIFNQVRFIGGWAPTVGTDGAYILSGNVNDSVEITFYGTGLNLIGYGAGSTRTASISIDGNLVTANIMPSSNANIIGSRNYDINSVISGVSGLTLGVHTATIKYLTGPNFLIYGFEVLNESSLVKVNSGVGYVQNKKYTSAALQSFAYNANSVGTRGGRVVVYQNGDGTIGRAYQAVNGAQGNLTSADHTNEEIARTYNYREFGAARVAGNDDFSLFSGAPTTERAFTLEDGTTTLIARNMANQATNGYDSFYTPNTTDFFTIIFVGTGLDLLVHESNTGAVDPYTVTIDGASIGSLDTTAVTGRNAVKKVVSGLPYGTHTAKFQRTAVSAGRGYSKFIVYQPKKPVVPSGTVELADYNIMADYSGATITGTTLADNLQMPLGTLYKAPAREFIYTGANQATFAIDATALPGLTTTTGTNNGQPTTLTFFGTGIVLHLGGTVAGTYDYSVTIDGSLNASGVARSNSTNLGGGSYRSTSSTAYFPTRVEFTGLALGNHTIVIQRTAGTGNFTFQGMHIITPIHSHRSNQPSDAQNTLPVGSQGMSDNRKTTPVKDALPAQKAWAQAVGVTSSPTTTSSLPVPMPDMSCTVKTSGGRLRCSFVGGFFVGTNFDALIRFYVDGVQVGIVMDWTEPTAGQEGGAPLIWTGPVAPGVHKVDVYWSTNGTATAVANRRILIVEEL